MYLKTFNNVQFVFFIKVIESGLKLFIEFQDKKLFRNKYFYRPQNGGKRCPGGSRRPVWTPKDLTRPSWI